MSHSVRFRFLLVITIFAVAAVATISYGQAAGQGAAPGGGQGQGGAQAGPPAQNPYLPAPYRMVPNWPPPDPAVKWGAVARVQTDAQGNLWVVQRGTPPIMKLDRKTGKFLGGFGAGMFAGLHGFTIDPDGNIIVSDCPLGPDSDQDAIKAGKGYQVFKMSTDGKVLMTIGQAGVSKAGRDTFYCPTTVLNTPDGNLLIADGHDNNPNTHYGDRIALFSKDGKYIRDIASMGSGPGQVWQPHSLAFDSQGRLFVADRSNNRVEILDINGNFLDIWRQFSRPSSIFIDTKTDTIYVGDSESSPTNHPDWPRGVRIGSTKSGAVHMFIPGTAPEGIFVDEDGNVYTCLSSRVLQKWEPVKQ